MPCSSNSNCGQHLVGSRVDQGRLQLLSILGYGAYGVVFHALDVSQGQHRGSKARQYAVKCQLKAGLDTRQRQFQRREIALHQLASKHRSVVTMHRVIEEGDYVFVIMDYCEDGDLFGMITEKQRYIGDDMLIKNVFLQIIDAVDYCHSLGIFHRDLKPENILCTNQGRNVFVADFGLATSERYSHDFGCGSTFYMSPECQGGIFERLTEYSTQTNDVWSLGIILVNLTCGRNPWQQARPSDDTFRAFIQNPNFLRTILPISHSLNYILRRIFTIEPKARLTLKQLRALIVDIDSFNMTDLELRTAHSAAQSAAAAVGKPRAAHQQDRPVKAAEVTGRVSNISRSSSATSSFEYRIDIQKVDNVYDNAARNGEDGASPRTPLLAMNRSRSSSSVESSSLPPTPPAPATAGDTIPIGDASFILDEPTAKSTQRYIPNVEQLEMEPPVKGSHRIRPYDVRSQLAL